MLQERVQSVDDAMFFLIIIGHELAHYVNKHLAHTDESKIDSVAIEGWADFFGARIMFTLITYGNQTALLRKSGSTSVAPAGLVA